MTDVAEHPIVILARHPDGSVEELPPARIDDIDQLTDRAGSLVWVSASSPDEALIADLGREFRLHPLALEDLRKQQQRPKIDTYEQQHMIVLHEAVPGAPGGLSEIHIFVGAGWLLSVTWTPAPMCDAVRRAFAGRRNGRINTTGELLYALLDAAVDSYFPELDGISDRLDSLEDRVLEGRPTARSWPTSSTSSAACWSCDESLRRCGTWRTLSCAATSRSSTPPRSPTTRTCTTTWCASSTRSTSTATCWRPCSTRASPSPATA